MSRSGVGRSSSSTALRLSAVGVVAGLTVPLCAIPSAFAAAASSEAAATGAYFYSAGVDKPEQSPADLGNPTAARTDGVASEHLAVAVRVPNRIDKKSFLSFDLSSVPFDATITKAIVSVPLAANATDNMVMNPAAAKVRACAAGDEGFNGEDGASFAQAPTEKCDVFAAPGKDSVDKKSYTFDVSKLAASWLTEANNGMALTVAEGATASPFQVVFLPFAKASIALQFTLPATAPDSTVVVPPVVVTEPSTTGGESGFSSDPGSFDGGVSSTPSTGGFDSAATPVFDAAPTPDVMSAPVPVTAPLTALAPVSFAPTRVSEVLTPTTGFWLAGLLFAGVLALLSLIMGDAKIPVRTASQTRLSQALAQRQRGARIRLSPLSA